ncbi:Cro/CI family transcriptional regulator [Pantoea agglomerans]|uniref:Cro/CI family transcriptional regulator n=1 Tax=Enterobacter agglomerans TaxID=549 RepID=UPI003C7D179E
MFKKDAILFFQGNQAALAKAAGVSPQAVFQWGDLVPEGRAQRLVEASEGALVYNKDVYDEYRKEKQKVNLIHENQSQGSEAGT